MDTFSAAVAREERGAVHVVRIPVLPFVKVLPAMRAITHFTLAGLMFAAGARQERHDLIIAYSPPLTLALASEGLGRLWRSPFILNVQDLYPQTLIDLGIVRNPIVVAVLRWMERRAYSSAAAITVHSGGNRELLIRGGVPEGKITVVPNWVDTSHVGRGGLNPYRAEWGLGDSFVVLFAGVMGYAQDMTIIIEAATRLQDEPGIVFVLVGDGVRRREAEALARSRGLTNVRFFPFQPVERYPLLVEAADCCLVTLQATVATPVVPSKIAGIMAASRPIVAAVPPGDAREIVEDSGGGICVPPGDSQALARAVLFLARDPASRRAMGEAGRRYVETHFSRRAATEIYGRLVEDLTRASAKDNSLAGSK
jgi:colanic acid biosynthesis glycosyl transferase WcaI